jgi:hypothetical protein
MVKLNPVDGGIGRGNVCFARRAAIMARCLQVFEPIRVAAARSDLRHQTAVVLLPGVVASERTAGHVDQGGDAVGAQRRAGVQVDSAGGTGRR